MIREHKKIIMTACLVVVIALIVISWGKLHKPSPGASDQAATSSLAVASSSTTASSSNTTSSAASTPPPSSTAASSSGALLLPAESAANIGHVFGIAAGGSLSKISTSTLNQELDQIVALGATWVRFDIEWGDVQYSSSSSFTWSSYDTLVNALVAHHLRGLGVILFTPQWARDPSCDNGVECPPANPATFATFAAQVAARYKNDGMHYWEIWNEPNTENFWAPKADCNGYAALLKATYPAIKQADPDAVVITGGLAPASTDGNNISPTDFLSCIYNAGAGNYFDAVGDHPYTYPSSPIDDGAGAWNQMAETSPSLRSIMTAQGDANKKIWITEFGAPTNGPDAQYYVSESEQSQMAADAIGLYQTYSWAGPFFWYTLEDGGNSTSTNENFFGLVRSDGSTKPAYQTLQQLIAAP